MRGSKTRRPRPKAPESAIGASAVGEGTTLRCHRTGALPLINHFLERLELAAILRRYLRKDDVRQKIATERVVSLLVCNVLISREPLYAVAEWAAQYGPELFNLYHEDIPLAR